MCFPYRLDNDGESQTSDIAQLLSVRALREYGFQIGIDDFGMGYSNLAYLDTLEVDYLKIDKAFVTGISSGTRSAPQ